jgi:hypothetical protein
MKTKIVTLAPTDAQPAFAFLMHKNGRPVRNRDGRIFCVAHTIEEAVSTLNRLFPVRLSETRKGSRRY